MIGAWLARAVATRLFKVGAPALVAALAIGGLWWIVGTYQQTKADRDAAVAEVLAFRRLATDATVPPDRQGNRALLTSADAKAALSGVFRDRDDARASLTWIDRETKAVEVRSDRADTALAVVQAGNVRRLGAAQGRIDALEAARPTADAVADAAGIEDDSKAAWEAWR